MYLHREAGTKFWKNRYLIEVVVGQVEVLTFKGRVIK